MAQPNATPSEEFIKRCKEDFKNRLEGAIRVHCSNEENRPNVLILDKVLWDFIRSHINFEYNERASEYTVSALPTAEITVTGLGRFTKAAVGGGVGGAGVGAVGGGGAGAGIGALIGIIGGPIGVGIGAAIGAGAGAAVGGAAGAVPGAGIGGWIANRFGRDIKVNWRKIYKKLTDQRDNDDNSGRLKLTFKLDASFQ